MESAQISEGLTQIQQLTVLQIHGPSAILSASSFGAYPPVRDVYGNVPLAPVYSRTGPPVIMRFSFAHHPSQLGRSSRGRDRSGYKPPLIVFTRIQCR